MRPPTSKRLEKMREDKELPKLQMPKQSLVRRCVQEGMSLNKMIDQYVEEHKGEDLTNDREHPLAVVFRLQQLQKEKEEKKKGGRRGKCEIPPGAVLDPEDKGNWIRQYYGGSKKRVYEEEKQTYKKVSVSSEIEEKSQQPFATNYTIFPVENGGKIRIVEVL
jgi:hypothetical protein